MRTEASQAAELGAVPGRPVREAPMVYSAATKPSFQTYKTPPTMESPQAPNLRTKSYQADAPWGKSIHFPWCPRVSTCVRGDTILDTGEVGRLNLDPVCFF